MDKPCFVFLPDGDNREALKRVHSRLLGNSRQIVVSSLSDIQKYPAPAGTDVIVLNFSWDLWLEEFFKKGGRIDFWYARQDRKWTERKTKMLENHGCILELYEESTISSDPQDYSPIVEMTRP